MAMPSAVAALHNAARHYCLHRMEYWRDKAVRLRSGGDSGGLAFARAALLEEILAEIEGFTPADFRDEREARLFLAEAANTGRTLFLQWPLTDAERRAVAEERAHVFAILTGLEPDAARAAPRLFHRRVLSAAEAGDILGRLETRWGISEGMFWYPLVPEAAPCPPGVEAFIAGPFDQPHILESLRSSLRSRGIERVWEIREAPPHYELEVAVFEPCYSLLEGFWSSSGCDWVAYASHEGSVTLGGRLLDAFKAAWPDWERWRFEWPPRRGTRSPPEAGGAAG